MDIVKSTGNKYTPLSGLQVDKIKAKIAKCRLKGLMSEPFIAAKAMGMTVIVGAVAPNGWEVKTAAVSGKYLYVNHDFWNPLTTAEQIGLLMHEYWHVSLGHDIRRGNKDAKLWNIACDHLINLMMIASGFTLPKGGLCDSKYTGWSEERIYHYLVDNAKINPPQPKKPKQQDGPVGSDGQGGGDPGDEPADDDLGSDDEPGDGTGDPVIQQEEGDGPSGPDSDSDARSENTDADAGDDGDGGDVSGDGDGDDDGNDPSQGKQVGDIKDRPPEPDADSSEASIKSKLSDAYEDVPWGEVWDATNEDGSALSESEKRDAMHDLKEDLSMAKNMHHSSAGNSGAVYAKRTVDNLVKPSTDWSTVLRSFFTKNGNPSGRSWSRLDRRGLQLGRYEPAEIKESVDWMVAFWDVSISMDWPAHRALSSQFTRIRQTVSVKRLTIVPFNTRVLHGHIVDLRPNDPIPSSFPVGGGTRFDAPFIWLQQQSGTPDGVVVFTDLGSAVSVPRPKCDVLWMSSEPVFTPGTYPGWPEYNNRPPWGKVVEIKVN